MVMFSFSSSLTFATCYREEKRTTTFEPLSFLEENDNFLSVFLCRVEKNWKGEKDGGLSLFVKEEGPIEEESRNCKTHRN